MRTFHTNTSSGDPNNTGASIGRAYNLGSGSYQNFNDSGLISTTSSKRSSFSQESPRSMMRENLVLGRNLISSQSLGLFEIQETLSLMLNEGDAARKTSQQSKDGRRVYIHVLQEISLRKQTGFKIFGHGHEPPIRIHLSKAGRKFTHEIEIVPLLTVPSFLGILNSGWATEDTSEATINECLKAMLQLSLKVQRDLRITEDLLGHFDPKGSGSAPRVDQTPSSKSQTPSGLGALSRWISSLTIPIFKKNTPISVHQ